MNDDTLELCFNEWLRRYTNDPAAFEAEFATVERFKRENDSGISPSYGAVCVAYLHKIESENWPHAERDE